MTYVISHNIAFHGNQTFLRLKLCSPGAHTHAVPSTRNALPPRSYKIYSLASLTPFLARQGPSLAIYLK